MGAAEQRNYESEVEQAQQQLADAQASLAKLEQQHDDFLLDGSNQQLVALEKKIDAAKWDVARLTARIPKLEALANQAGEDAKQAELGRLYRRADEARQVAERLIVKEYRPAAEQIAAVLRKLVAIEEFVEITNNQLTRGNYADRVSNFNSIRCEDATIRPAHTEVNERRHGPIVTGPSKHLARNDPGRPASVVDISKRHVPETRSGGRSPARLDTAVIPPATWAPRSLWDGEGHTREARRDYLKILKEAGL